jgi:ABC-2 type transport system ATP-binding protein
MTNESPIISIDNLHRSFGRTDAVNGLSLQVKRGRCYGFFGRNGAGKTTTIKCLLNLLRPTQGEVRLFGLNPEIEEIETKSRLTYVPDQIAVYPWMTVASYFEYLAAFRKHWNPELQDNLLLRFDLDPKHKASSLSKGQKVQMALIAALCPEPELLILDEPTSGLDPLIRREFIEAVIGAYQESDPENRTVLVSTHLITEFEGLIDEFTILDQGRSIYSAETEIARTQFQRWHLRFRSEVPELQSQQIVVNKSEGRTAELITHGDTSDLERQLNECELEESRSEALTLEEIFLTTAKHHRDYDFSNN